MMTGRRSPKPPSPKPPSPKPHAPRRHGPRLHARKPTPPSLPRSMAGWVAEVSRPASFPPASLPWSSCMDNHAVAAARPPGPNEQGSLRRPTVLPRPLFVRAATLPTAAICTRPSLGRSLGAQRRPPMCLSYGNSTSSDYGASGRRHTHRPPCPGNYC